MPQSRIRRLIAHVFTGRLWRNADFLRLWAAQTVSRFGSQVSVLALPTVAILALHATPVQVGILGALEFLAFPVLGLVAGVYADRLRRRPILVVCDLARALTLASVPAAFAAGHLTIYQLYGVATLTGIFTVFFDVSDQSYLPSLIERADLVEGNSKLTVSDSTAQVAGPAVAGVLIQALGAAMSVTADAVSFVASGLLVLSIRRPEPAPERDPGTPPSFIGELREGLNVVLGNPVLRRIAATTSTSNLGSNMYYAVILIFAYRVLHLSPATLGLTFGVASLGSLAGALTAGAVTRRLGLGRTLLASIVLTGAGLLIAPLAILGWAPVCLAVSGALTGFATPVYNINQVSLRQAITPHRVQGRMNATMRTIVWGTIPIGMVVGGLLGNAIGIIPTLLVGCAVATTAGGFLLSPAILAIRVQPEPVSDCARSAGGWGASWWLGP